MSEEKFLLIASIGILILFVMISLVYLQQGFYSWRRKQEKKQEQKCYDYCVINGHIKDSKRAHQLIQILEKKKA